MGDPRTDLPADPWANVPPESQWGTRHPSRYEAERTITGTEVMRRDRCRITRTSGQSLTSGVTTIINFDTVVFDASGMADTTVHVGRITIPPGLRGMWIVSAQLMWGSSIAGTIRQAQINKNGLAIATDIVPPSVNVSQNPTNRLIIFENEPSPGDFYEVTGLQDSGGNLSIFGATDRSYFELIHLW